MQRLNSHPSGRHFLQIPGPTNVPDRILRAIDHPTIETARIAFDYRPQPGELDVPASFAEGDLRQLRELAKAAGL